MTSTTHASPARRLDATIDRVTPALEALASSDTGARAVPGRWSKRETVGHLIDSAANNHQRFVRMRDRDDLVIDGYDQDAWVAAQRYQDAPWLELVALWRLYNRHLVRVIDATPSADLRRPRVFHNLDQRAYRQVPRVKPTTLEYFMNDYVDHLEHHLAQVLG